MSDYDVIVVGAGPAGTVTARACALNGLSTLLVDKERFPRDKICGGGLTPLAYDLLEPLPEGLVEASFSKTRICYKHHVHEKDYGMPVVRTVERELFDKYLLDQAVDAGVVFNGGVFVDSFERTAGGINLSVNGGQVSAKILVGADGVNSKVALFLGNKPSDTAYNIACDVKVPLSKMQGLNDALSFYFGVIPAGYGWIFPKKNNCSVGLGCILGRQTDLDKHFTGFMDLLGLDDDFERQYAIIPIGDFKKKIVSDNTLLVGDAAGLAEPLTGEGLYYAVKSGMLASETIVKAFKSNDFSRENLGGYADASHACFGEELRRARKSVKVLDRFPGIAFPMILKNESVVDKFIEIQRGNISYLDFKHWILPRLPILFFKAFCLK